METTITAKKSASIFMDDIYQLDFTMVRLKLQGTNIAVDYTIATFNNQ